MRLPAKQILIIKHLAQEVFGATSQVYLFGSRTQAELKGGDIDLYIVPEAEKANLKNQLKLSAKLQVALGEQKIDIVLAEDNNRLIEQEALTKGIKL